MLRHHMSPNRVINAALPPVLLFYRRVATAGVFTGVAGAGRAGMRIDYRGALYECQRRRSKFRTRFSGGRVSGDSDVSRVCQPPLTTMAVPHRKIGSEAGCCWKG